MNINAVR